MERTVEILQPDRERVDTLTAELACHPVLSTLLVNRGIADPRTAADFLRPALKNLRPPNDLCDAARAAERISEAIENKEKILVFGDYDVDGVTATCLLTEFLARVGGRVSYYIPHRLHEGYSLSPAHFTNGAVVPETGLVITVDCGISSRDAVAAAARAGIDVIVTDHHRITTPLPEAVAVVNPNRADCLSGLGALAGVGVVFYLVIALRAKLRDRGHFESLPEPNLKEFCDLVALGTVADMVPLIHENRILAAIGLDVINRGIRPGLRSLIETSHLQCGRVVSEDIAYRLAPRLNAAGRLNHASEAVELLRAAQDAPAARMATALDDLNQERRRMEHATLKAIETLLEQSPDLARRPAIVLSNPQWHPGVTGIVAARLARRYHRPVFLVCMPDDIGKGSGRSIPGIDMVGCLEACAASLERYGGHPAAAGITVTRDKFDSFRELFEKAVKKIADRGIPPESVRVDCEIDLDAIRPDLVDMLSLLEPFGQGNPEPLFLARDVQVAGPRRVGRNHIRLTLIQQKNGTRRSLPAIFFNAGSVPEKADRVVFTLQWNHWNGRKRLQAVIKQMA